MTVDTESIALHAEALHNFLTARLLEGWEVGAVIRSGQSDGDLVAQVRTVLADLDRLRYHHRRTPVSADRWADIRDKLERVYRATTDAMD